MKRLARTVPKVQRSYATAVPQITPKGPYGFLPGYLPGRDFDEKEGVSFVSQLFVLIGRPGQD
jgi:hypothetical protein